LIVRRRALAAGNSRAERPTTFSEIIPAVDRRRCQRHDRAREGAASRDQELATLPAVESTDRVGPAAAILVQADLVTERDRRAQAAMAVGYLADRVAVVKADFDRIVRAEAATVVFGQIVPVAAAIDQVDLAVVVMMVVRGAPVIDRTVRARVAAASNGVREIDRAVLVIGQTIVPIAVPIGTSGRIGATIVGPT
jgi:hypothetical protein